VAGRFADGVWLAELASLQDPALVASVVAVALGVREQPGEPAADALARAHCAVARLLRRRCLPAADRELRIGLTTFDGVGIVAAHKPVIGQHGEAVDTFDRK
jgi:predicted ATPase